MSVAGKKKTDWEAVTLCDFGQPNRREVLRAHFSITSALKAYESFKKNYGRNSIAKVGYQCRIWQEDKEGNIINDSDNDG